MSKGHCSSAAIIFMLPFLPKSCFQFGFSLTPILPALISLCPEAWDEPWRLVDNSIWETHCQGLHCARLSQVSLCLLSLVVWWLGYRLGELNKMELALLEEGESGTGSPPLPQPRHPKNSGGNGYGQAWRSGRGSRWSSYQPRPPPQAPSWPP